MIKNLLRETEEVLAHNGKDLSDVMRIVTVSYSAVPLEVVPVPVFRQIADIEYDAGYGEVAVKKMKIYGMDFIMERRDYKGREWWQFISTEVPNTKHMDVAKSLLSEEEA